MIPDITFCIATKNNLRYLKEAVRTIRTNCTKEHPIKVFIDTDSDGTAEWCAANNITYILNDSENLLGIGNAYNLLVEQATTEFVLIWHADMLCGANLDDHLYGLWAPRTVISATRIEPPLHPADPSKIIMDFGLWPESNVEDGFKEKEFNDYVASHQTGLVTEGIFAPWLIHKDDFNAVGGHDPIMRSHSEDRDLFNRFLLAGYSMKQCWNALVYHLTCRGGQFEHANKTNDLDHKSSEWNKLAYRQTREFIRKWGTPPLHTPYQYPIVIPKYNIGFVIDHCTYKILESVEPYCATLYVQNSPNYVDLYVNAEPTSYNLKTKIRDFNAIKTDDVIVTFEGRQLTRDNIVFLFQLPQILQETTELGKFVYDIFTIEIKSHLTLPVA